VRRSPIWAERNGVQLVDDSEDLYDDAKDSDGDRRGRLRVSASLGEHPKPAMHDHLKTGQ
jgi:hypothetical protein